MGTFFFLLLIGASAQSRRPIEGAPVVRAEFSFVHSSLSAPVDYEAPSFQPLPQYTDRFLNTFRAQDRTVYQSFPDLFSAMNQFSLPGGSRSDQTKPPSSRPSFSPLPPPSTSPPSPLPPSPLPPTASPYSWSSNTGSSYINSLTSNKPIPTSYNLLSTYLPSQLTSSSDGRGGFNGISSSSIGAARVAAYYSSLTSSQPAQAFPFLPTSPALPSSPSRPSESGYSQSSSSGGWSSGGTPSQGTFYGDYNYDPDPLTPFSDTPPRPRVPQPSPAAAEEAAVMVFGGPVALRVPAGNVLQLVPLTQGLNANALLFPDTPQQTPTTTIVYSQQGSQQGRDSSDYFPRPPLPASSNFPPLPAPMVQPAAITSTPIKFPTEPPLHSGQVPIQRPTVSRPLLQPTFKPSPPPSPKRPAGALPSPTQKQVPSPTQKQVPSPTQKQVPSPTQKPSPKPSAKAGGKLTTPPSAPRPTPIPQTIAPTGKAGKARPISPPTRAPQLTPSALPPSPMAPNSRLVPLPRPRPTAVAAVQPPRAPCSSFLDCELCVTDFCEWNIENVRCLNTNECQPANATYCIFWPRDCPGSTFKFRDVP